MHSPPVHLHVHMLSECAWHMAAADDEQLRVDG